MLKKIILFSIMQQIFGLQAEKITAAILHRSINQIKQINQINSIWLLLYQIHGIPILSKSGYYLSPINYLI